MSAADPDVQWRHARRWIAKAEGDLRLARLALEAEPPIVDGAAFHCQQAGEKLVKALLVVAARRVPKTHDMEHLVELALEAHPTLEPQLRAIEDLTSWGIATRYPPLSSATEPGTGDVEAALVRVEALHQAVLTQGAGSPT